MWAHNEYKHALTDNRVAAKNLWMKASLKSIVVLLAALFVGFLMGCPSSTIQAGGHINRQPTWFVYGKIAPGPVSNDPTATSGSIISITPTANGFTVMKSQLTGFSVRVLKAPLGSPPLKGIANVRVDVEIGPGNDQGVSSILRYQGAVGTALTTMTDSTGTVQFDLQATSDGDDDIIIGVLVEDRSGNSGWVRRWRISSKQYETSNQ